GAVAEAAVVVSRLLNAGNHADGDEPGRIGDRLPGELKLLPRVQWSRIGEVGHPEVREDAEYALPLLLLDLLLGNLDPRRGHVHADRADDEREPDGRQKQGFSRRDDPGQRLRRKSSCRHGETKGAGGDVGEREPAIGARNAFDPFATTLALERD